MNPKLYTKYLLKNIKVLLKQKKTIIIFIALFIIISLVAINPLKESSNQEKQTNIKTKTQTDNSNIQDNEKNNISRKQRSVEKEGNNDTELDNFEKKVKASLNKIIMGPSLTHQEYYNKAWEIVNKDGELSYDAIAYYTLAIQGYPTWGGYYNDRGNCYRSFKQYKKAEKDYSNAIRYGFEKSFVFYNRAICNYEIGNLADAEKDYDLARRKGWSNDWYELKGKINQIYYERNSGKANSNALTEFE